MQAALTSDITQHFYLPVWFLADTQQEKRKVSEQQDQKNLKKGRKEQGVSH